jgi:flagellin FlaB
MNSLQSNDKGFTGLEAAIVLIAFVVVAAVFSYVVLGAGFFTTQKAQESVHTAVGQATSAVELSGPVMVQAGAAAGSVSNASFYLQLAAGGAAVDVKKIGYTVSTSKKVYTVQGNDSQVNIHWLKTIAEGNLLEPREMVLIDLNVGTTNGGMGFSASDMTVNDKMTIEVKPPVGSSLPITRTIPAALNNPTWYEVY